MGLQAAPAYIADPTFNHPAELDRNMTKGLWPRSGAVEYGNFALSVGVGTRAIAVAANGRYVIQGAENATQGSYFVWGDTAETYLLAAAVGNPRIDTFILRVADNQYGTIGGSPSTYIDVVQGVAAGAPTARPNSDFQVGGPFYVPGAWSRLGDVRVNLADTGSIPAGQITNNWQYAVQPGRYIMLPSTARPLVPALGDRIYETDTGFRRYWNGTAWVQAEPYIMVVQAGAPIADVQFNSVPSSLRQLRITYGLRSVAAVLLENLMLRINGVAGGHLYNRKSQSSTTLSNLANDQTNNHFPIGLIPGASSGAANDYGDGDIIVNGWHSPNTMRAKVLWTSGVYTSTSAYLENGQGMFTNAGPYTSLRLFTNGGSNFQTGSWARLEGWE